MSKIERSIVIDRPLEEVWGFVHEPANDPRWQPTIVESETSPEGPIRAGSRIREVRRFLGVRLEISYEVTGYDPPSRSSVKSVSGPIPFSGSYVFESLDGSTRFTVSGELDAHGFFKLAEPVFTRIAGRELEANLGHLKDLLEAEPAPSGRV
jgi:uncharacterized membrane protein